MAGITWSLTVVQIKVPYLQSLLKRNKVLE